MLPPGTRGPCPMHARACPGHARALCVPVHAPGTPVPHACPGHARAPCMPVHAPGTPVPHACPCMPRACPCMPVHAPGTPVPRACPCMPRARPGMPGHARARPGMSAHIGASLFAGRPFSKGFRLEGHHIRGRPPPRSNVLGYPRFYLFLMFSLCVSLSLICNRRQSLSPAQTKFDSKPPFGHKVCLKSPIRRQSLSPNPTLERTFVKKKLFGDKVCP